MARLPDLGRPRPSPLRAAVARRVRRARRRARRLAWWGEPWAWVLSGRLPATADRVATYAAIRDRGRAVRAKGGAVLVAGYDLSRSVLRDHATYSSRPASAIDPALSGLEGDAHRAVRGPLATAFSAEALAGRGPWFRTLADDALRAMAASGERDFRAGFADPYAYGVGAALFGIGHVPAHCLQHWAGDRIVRYAAAGPDDDAAGRAFRAAAQEALGRARSGRAPDGLGALGAIPRAVATAETFERSLAAMLMASGQTTSTSTVHLVQALYDHPDQEAAVRADPASRPAFVDEVLRLASPLVVVREATAPARLGDLDVVPWTRVHVLLEAANRDPAVFDEPEAFRPGRPGRHLFFGHGPHYCVGHRFAREELARALDAVLDAWPSVRAAFRPAFTGPQLAEPDAGFTVREAPRVPAS